MCFYIKELDTGEHYKVRNEADGKEIICHLSRSFDEAISNLEFIGSEAPNEYDFLKKCFRR